ncbi:hypothetical protein Q5P01_000564 [Channa striata]|uniref:Uncharacterized protein n=1 Tax=Channa striata TaxID=64152 RepID=A0AA88IL08_CHASR|nr:hypothetical protein Q5P01_000564 [Channa striata]
MRACYAKAKARVTRRRIPEWRKELGRFYDRYKEMYKTSSEEAVSVNCALNPARRRAVSRQGAQVVGDSKSDHLDVRCTLWKKKLPSRSQAAPLSSRALRTLQAELTEVKHGQSQSSGRSGSPDIPLGSAAPAAEIVGCRGLREKRRHGGPDIAPARPYLGGGEMRERTSSSGRAPREIGAKLITRSQF